jgi:serine/threonine-protein kinase
MSKDGEPIAIKVFHTADPASARRELAFAQDRLGRTDEHVITIYGCGVDPTGGHACIVMSRGEYSLAQRLTKDGPFAETAAVAIAHAIVKGLLSVPSWVHRDLKPANILWANAHWQLTDFGIARTVNATTALSTMKHYLSAPYAAPEQWNGERATHKTDVYALGCLLHELIAKHPPFRGPDWDDFAEQHRMEAPALLVGSPRLKSLLSLMLNKSPNARPTLEQLDSRFSAWEIATFSGKAANGLAQAAAQIAEEQARIFAGTASINRDGRDRRLVQEDGLRELDDLSRELFDRIYSVAPNATMSIRRDNPYPTRSVQLGSGSLVLSIGQHLALPSEVFSQSGWDVICGDFIKVAQADGRGRSASLWYMRRGDAPYEWVEVAYWHLGNRRTQNPEPCYLQPGRDADLAAANLMHIWALAHPPRPLRADERHTFIERWIEYFTSAALGSFQSPSTLPER